MNLLLDTCAFLWLTLSPEQLSQNAVNAITDPMNYVFLSTISAWEISMKYGRRQLALDSPPRIFIPQKCAEQSISILPLDVVSATRIDELPRVHKDPFDRILVCQALTYDMAIVTPDPDMQAYSIKTVW